MDESDLPTSPRKKLKIHHDPDINMADSAATKGPSAEPPEDGPSEENRPGKEMQCGILEYVSPHLPGFTGILKKRYTDFLVNEILPNGRVVHLDNYKKPSEQKEPSQEAFKGPQKQTSQLGQPVREPRHPASTEENARPQFVSTNLNQIEEGSRKKEKVYMRHGADSLTLVNGKDDPDLNDANPTTSAIRNENIQHEAPKPTGSDSEHMNGSIPHSNEEEPVTVSDEQKTPSNGAPDVAEPAVLTQPLPIGTVGGWQAYAQSKTNGGGSTDNSIQLSAEDKDLLNSYFDTEVVEQILSLFQRILATPQRKARDFGTVTTKSIARDVRTDIHQALRRIFSSRLESSTSGDGAMVISAANPSSSRGQQTNGGRNGWDKRPQQPKGKAGWAVLGGDYLHFTLYKENKDTMEVISYLAKVLKLRPGLFQFAGTKDRRGITTQRASVYRIQAKKLIDAGRTLRNARIGNYEYHTQGLQLGDLTGNEFVITLRDCHFKGDEDLDINVKTERASSILRTAIENFTLHGFINYYGLQRFGSFSTGTHTIGRSMLQGDFQSACNAILYYNPAALAAAQQGPDQQDSKISRDDKARASALHAFATTGRIQQALNELPSKFSAEACLIRHLARSDQKNDYLGALQTINRNLRLMYVHAYQSLVWNTAATARWRIHGAKVLPGDLVLITEHPDPSTQPSANGGMDVDQDGEPIVAASSDDRAYTSDEIFTRARHITEAELASSKCKISIFDLVLPTPGYDILYPANGSANIYKDFMASEEGGGLDPMDMRRKWKDVSLSGSYRKLLAKPLGKVEWEMQRYGARGEDEQFVETDAERLRRGEGEKQWARQNDSSARGNTDIREEVAQGAYECPNHNHCAGKVGEVGQSCSQCATCTTSSSSSTAPTAIDTTLPSPATAMNAETIITAPDESKGDSPGKAKNDKIAVVLKMQLGSSTYATMALRELMKEGGVRTWKAEFGAGR
ncbi:MAG: hypothetical protein Q9224_004997 [Gallowayella concinna]